MSIVLHIDRLVIDEALLGGERPDRVRATIERELAQRLMQPGTVATLAGLGQVASLPTLDLLPGASATLGHRLARTLARSVSMPTDNGSGHV